jgi:hypothetical protein
MFTGERPLLPPANETVITVSDHLAALSTKMEPGYNQLNGNENLENAYLDYRATGWDEQYADVPNYYSFDELPKHEQNQANAMVDQLVYNGLGSASILRSRLQHLRVLKVDNHTADGKAVGGQFIDGLVVVADKIDSEPRTTAQPSILCSPKVYGRELSLLDYKIGLQASLLRKPMKHFSPLLTTNILGYFCRRALENTLIKSPLL